MDKSKEICTLMLIMITVSVVIGGLTIGLLYRTHFETERQQLVDIVQNQVGMIEAITRFDAIYSQDDHPKGARYATIGQIRAGLKNINDKGASGNSSWRSE